MDRATVRAVLGLIDETWPPEGDVRPAAERVEAAVVAWEPSPSVCRFLVREGGRVVAHAAAGVRTIGTGEGNQEVVTLAGVCVAADRRGRGLGAVVVRRAFAEAGPGRVVLFQTGVPEFYRKLGAREVGNPFFHRPGPGAERVRPWWDPHVLVWPADASWPDGPVDLRGPGY